MAVPGMHVFARMLRMWCYCMLTVCSLAGVAAAKQQYRAGQQPQQQLQGSAAGLHAGASVATTATYLQDTTGQLIAPGIYNIGGVPMMLTLDGVGDAAFQAVAQTPAVAELPTALLASKSGAASKEAGDKLGTLHDKGIALGRA
jgi:hypothetical protein